MRGRVTLNGLLKAVASLTAVFSLVTLLRIDHHLVDLFVHFRLQYLLASAVLFCLFLWLRERTYAGVMFVCLVLSSAYIAPWYLADPPTGGDTPLKLIHVNVQSSNTEYQRVIDLVAEEEPDIVFVQEVSPEWAAELSPLASTLPHSYSAARQGKFGIAVFSRLPFESVSHVDSPPLNYPTIVATSNVDGESVTFFSTHPMIPVGGANYDARNEQISSLVQHVAGTTGRIVFSGDMNASLWDPKLAEFEKATGLVNVRNGSGLLPSWPTFFLPAMIPIDHAFVSPGIGVVEVRNGRHIGSDHLPLVVTITL